MRRPWQAPAEAEPRLWEALRQTSADNGWAYHAAWYSSLAPQEAEARGAAPAAEEKAVLDAADPNQRAFRVPRGYGAPPPCPPRQLPMWLGEDTAVAEAGGRDAETDLAYLRGVIAGLADPESSDDEEEDEDSDEEAQTNDVSDGGGAAGDGGEEGAKEKKEESKKKTKEREAPGSALWRDPAVRPGQRGWSKEPSPSALQLERLREVELRGGECLDRREHSAVRLVGLARLRRDRVLELGTPPADFGLPWGEAAEGGGEGGARGDLRSLLEELRAEGESASVRELAASVGMRLDGSGLARPGARRPGDVVLLAAAACSWRDSEERTGPVMELLEGEGVARPAPPLLAAAQLARPASPGHRHAGVSVYAARSLNVVGYARVAQSRQHECTYEIS